MAAATNEVRSLLALMLLDLEKSPPLQGVEALQLAVEARAPRPAQSDLFLPPAPAPERLQTTLARLAALCGPDQVGTLLPANSHRPEALERIDFAPPPPSASRPEPERNGQAVNRIVLRAFRPPQEVEVMFSAGYPSLCGAGSLAPAWFQSRDRGAARVNGGRRRSMTTAARKMTARLRPDAACPASRTITTRWRWMTAEFTAYSATCGPIAGSSMEFMTDECGNDSLGKAVPPRDAAGMIWPGRMQARQNGRFVNRPCRAATYGRLVN